MLLPNQTESSAVKRGCQGKYTKLNILGISSKSALGRSDEQALGEAIKLNKTHDPNETWGDRSERLSEPDRTGVSQFIQQLDLQSWRRRQRDRRLAARHFHQ